MSTATVCGSRYTVYSGVKTCVLDSSHPGSHFSAVFDEELGRFPLGTYQWSDRHADGPA